MKIAIIVRKLNIRGGTQRQAVNLANELQKVGHEIKIYTFVYSPENCYEELLKNFKVVCLDNYPKRSNYFLNLFLENKLSKKLAFMIDEDTEILNPHDQVSYKIAAYFKKKVKNIPSVWMMNDMPTKTWSFWRENQVNPQITAFVLKRIIYRLVDFYDYFKFIRHQDKIVVLDNRDKDWARKYFYKKADVIRSGLDLEKFSYRERSFLPEKIKILMIGIFFPHRKFEDGVMALKKLREKGNSVELTIVGGYDNGMEYHKKLIDLVNKLELTDYVKLAGHISGEKLREYYQKSDIFLFPSHLQSWGLVVFEAMASGLPVIISNTTGASEVLTSYENSIIVEPNKPVEISEAVLNLINNPSLYKKLSKSGRNFVEKNISWPNYTKQMIKIFLR